MTIIRSESSESYPGRLGPTDLFFRGEPDDDEDEDEDEEEDRRKHDKDRDDNEEDDNDDDGDDESGGYSVSSRTDFTG